MVRIVTNPSKGVTCAIVKQSPGHPGASLWWGQDQPVAKRQGSHTFASIEQSAI